MDKLDPDDEREVIRHTADAKARAFRDKALANFERQGMSEEEVAEFVVSEAAWEETLMFLAALASRIRERSDEQGVSRGEIAARTGLSHAEVDGVFTADITVPLRSYIAIAELLGDDLPVGPPPKFSRDEMMSALADSFAGHGFPADFVETVRRARSHREFVHICHLLGGPRGEDDRPPPESREEVRELVAMAFAQVALHLMDGDAEQAETFMTMLLKSVRAPTEDFFTWVDVVARFEELEHELGGEREAN